MDEAFSAAKTRFWVLPMITFAAAFAQPVMAQSTAEIAQFRKGTLDLVLQCPGTGTDYEANIAQCLPIEQKLKDRRAAATVKWRWADDLLQRRLWTLQGRIALNYFRRDGRRSPDTCQYTEKAWLSLNRISIEGRSDWGDFSKARASVVKVVEACRIEIGTPDWAAPMALGQPSPSE